MWQGHQSHAHFLEHISAQGELRDGTTEAGLQKEPDKLHASCTQGVAFLLQFQVFYLINAQ